MQIIQGVNELNNKKPPREKGLSHTEHISLGSRRLDEDTISQGGQLRM